MSRIYVRKDDWQALNLRLDAVEKIAKAPTVQETITPTTIITPTTTIISGGNGNGGNYLPNVFEAAGDLIRNSQALKPERIIRGNERDVLTVVESVPKWVPWQNWINVKTFGATGNGVSDDRSAIQAAIDYIRIIGGGVVYFPYGTYYISNYIEITSNNVWLVGDGMGSIITVGSTNDLLRITGTVGTHITCANVRDLFLYRSAINPAAGNGIKIVYADAVIVSDVTLHRHYGGIYIGGSQFSTFRNIQINRGGTGANNSYGFYIDSSAAYNSSIYFDHCVYVGADSAGFNYGFFATGLYVADMYFDCCEVDIADYGWYIYANTITNTNIHWVRPIADTIYNTGIYILNGVGFSINGGWLHAAAALAQTYGIFLEDCGRCTIQGTKHWGAGNAGNHDGIKADGCHGIAMMGGTFEGCEKGIVLQNATNLCSIVGNIFYNPNGNTAATYIEIGNTGASARNSVIGNVLTGYAVTGIHIGATGTYNEVIGNQVEPTNITTEIDNDGGATNDIAHNIIA